MWFGCDMFRKQGEELELEFEVEEAEVDAEEAEDVDDVEELEVIEISFVVVALIGGEVEVEFFRDEDAVKEGDVLKRLILLVLSW